MINRRLTKTSKVCADGRIQRTPVIRNLRSDKPETRALLKVRTEKNNQEKQGRKKNRERKYSCEVSYINLLPKEKFLMGILDYRKRGPPAGSSGFGS